MIPKWGRTNPGDKKNDPQMEVFLGGESAGFEYDPLNGGRANPKGKRKSTPQMEVLSVAEMGGI